MGFLSGLFGGSKSTSTTTGKDVTPPEFVALRGPVADALQALFGAPLAQGGGVPGTFPTPSGAGLTAPLGGAEESLLSNLTSLLSGPSQFGTGKELLGRTLGGEFLSPESNPFLRATIEAAQRPILEGLTETLTRDLPGRFTQAGQFIQPGGSSAFDRAAAIATRGATQQLGDIGSQISFANLQQERARQQEGIKISQGEITQTIEGLRAAALPRFIEQFGIDRGVEEFDKRIQRVLAALQLATGVPLVNVAQEGRTTQRESPNIFGALTGAFGAAFPAGI